MARSLGSWGLFTGKYQNFYPSTFSVEGQVWFPPSTIQIGFSGSPLLRQLREGLLQMLGCDVNKEKNFPNLFPFLFLAEDKWSPESSYHDDIGIRQKKILFTCLKSHNISFFKIGSLTWRAFCPHRTPGTKITVGSRRPTCYQEIWAQRPKLNISESHRAQ